MPISKKEMIENLKELKSLFDAGVFTQEEYDAQKAEIIASASLENNKSGSDTAKQTNEEEKSKEEKPKKDEPVESFKAAGVVCPQCGSGSTTKVDDYTYICNMCGTTIALPRPDTNIVNINSSVSGDSSVPVIQIAKTLDNEQFIRKSILTLAKAEDVAPRVLQHLIIDRTSIMQYWATFADIEYSAELSYTCEIGTNYEFQDCNGHTKQGTNWTQFSGTAKDDGSICLCANSERGALLFIKNQNLAVEEFAEKNGSPLSRRIDEHALEFERQRILKKLSGTAEDDLPGDKNRNFKYTGNCEFGEIYNYYYVPAYSAAGRSEDDAISFDCVAVATGSVTYHLPKEKVIDHEMSESEEDEYYSDENIKKREENAYTMPEMSDAKNKMKYRYGSFNSLSLFMIVFSYIVAIGSLVGMFMAMVPLLIPGAVSLVSAIVSSVTRKKFINDVLDNLIIEFKNAKAIACNKCLRANNLPSMTASEMESIGAGQIYFADLKESKRKAALTVLMILSFVALILGVVLAIKYRQSMMS